MRDDGTTTSRVSGKTKIWRNEKKENINCAPKQEQQIRINNDWQIPSCFKCLLQLFILENVCITKREARQDILIFKKRSLPSFICICCYHEAYNFIEEIFCYVSNESSFITHSNRYWTTRGRVMLKFRWRCNGEEYIYDKNFMIIINFQRY